MPKHYRPDLTALAANEPLLPLSVYGAGTVGLVTAACLAELGHVVLCMDSDVARVAQLARGQLPFVEPGLEDLIVRNGRRGQSQEALPQAGLVVGVAGHDDVGKALPEQEDRPLVVGLRLVDVLGRDLEGLVLPELPHKG